MLPSKLTQNQLKAILHYNPKTGIFVWINSAGNIPAGSVAGQHIKDGYVLITINSKKYRAHRLAFLYMEGEFPSNICDHKNRIRHDNSWENLRHATYRQNNQNSISNNKVRGVCMHKGSKKWTAHGIRTGTGPGSLPYLGLYIEYWDAVCARKKYETTL